MSYSLRNGRFDIRMTCSMLPLLLTTAKEYGWEPAGTINEDYPDWGGGYCWNSGQQVTAEDAAGIADALELVRQDALKCDANESSSIALDVIEGQSVPKPQPEILSYSNQFLVDVIALCRSGAFSIH